MRRILMTIEISSEDLLDDVEDMAKGVYIEWTGGPSSYAKSYDDGVEESPSQLNRWFIDSIGVEEQE